MEVEDGGLGGQVEVDSRMTNGLVLSGVEGMAGGSDQESSEVQSESGSNGMEGDGEDEADAEGEDEVAVDVEGLLREAAERNSDDRLQQLTTTADPLSESRQRAQVLDGVSTDDMIDDWPFPIEPCLKAIKLSSSEPSMSTLPFILQLVYTIVVSLSSTFNTPRRATEFVLQSFWQVLQLSAPFVFNKAQPHCATCKCPGRSAEEASRTEPIVPAKRMPAVERQLGFSADLALHPVCPNKTCNHIHFETSNGVLPDDIQKCTQCATDLYDDKGSPRYKVYPRNHLINELERVLAKEGVEELVFSVGERQEISQNESERSRSAFMRNQADGLAWEDSESPIDDEETPQTIILNPACDWFKSTSTGFHRPRSVGPISATIANLPNEFRSDLSLTLLLGITPGKSFALSEI
jgi:hypothetical protein